jgi:hypothetical protein
MLLVGRVILIAAPYADEKLLFIHAWPFGPSSIIIEPAPPCKVLHFVSDFTLITVGYLPDILLSRNTDFPSWRQAGPMMDASV